MKKLIVFALICALCVSTTAFAEDSGEGLLTYAPAPVDGTIRVMLQSLGGSVQALGLTLDGVYAVDGDRGFQFERGTEIALGLENGEIYLSAGGVTINMGGGFTLTRHAPEDGNGAGGAYLHESQKDTLYCGDLSFGVHHGGIRVIVTMGIEDYLYGVVPYEMSDTFPLEALKAQAVAARTYAMQRVTKNAGEAYDVVDTTQDQVFRGLDARYALPIQAVNETRGIVGMWNGRYAECFYTASNGGQTALPTDIWGNAGDFGYLEIKDDPYDLQNPLSLVKTAFVSEDGAQMRDALRAALTARLTNGGEIVRVLGVEAIQPLYGGGSRQYGMVRFTLETSPDEVIYFSDGGETTPIGVDADPETVTVDLPLYAEARAALGVALNSGNYELIETAQVEGGFTVTARRYGHGVGMSQRGAQQMAGVHGMNHLEILHFYYPGMALTQLTWLEKPLTPVAELPESLGYAAPRPTPAPTPAPLPQLLAGEYYAVVTVDGVDSTLNIRAEPSLSADILGVLRNGTRLIVTGEIEGWARMKTAEYEGYVSMDFIVKE